MKRMVINVILYTFVILNFLKCVERGCSLMMACTKGGKGVQKKVFFYDMGGWRVSKKRNFP